ncbi:acyl carrier protein (plasmid) [Streptomyces sp. NBC_01136]|uniref:acyl carrier protein n=1 Tax=Streptomyces sp. NBC_01136 TaxID=2903754 RepID=UPI00386E51DC|nr:acyl carrier protein [Streptomyces sp. NBC_01136]
MTGDVEYQSPGQAGAAEIREDAGHPPGAGERELAALWADALGVPVERIRRSDNFFEIGGTSRAAARLVMALERRLSVDDFARTPTLAHMADLFEQRCAGAEAEAAGG